MKRTLISGFVIAAAILSAPAAFNFLLAGLRVVAPFASPATNELVTAIKDARESCTPSAHASVARRQDDLPERDEINQNFTLAPGAQVTVSGINGGVTVETAEGSAAEVHVVRSARTREDLQYHRIIVEQTGGGLTVRGEKDEQNFGRDHRVRQRVTLRVPRRVELEVRGVNGGVHVGELEGAARISGVNGGVEVAQAVGYTDLSGINGGVHVLIARLGERGLRASGINGGVELRFADTLNADLHVHGINGEVVTDVPNVTVEGRMNRNNFNAKIGAGGAPIEISGINGRVRLTQKGAAVL